MIDQMTLGFVTLAASLVLACVVGLLLRGARGREKRKTVK